MDNFDLKKYLAEGKLLKEGNMKTPMQELIEQLKEERDEHGYERGQHYDTAIEFAESMLEKEKEVIMYAYMDGQNNGIDISHPLSHIKEVGAEQYYEETFKTK